LTVPLSIIDVHTHIVPPVYARALRDTGLAGRDRFPVPVWDAQGTLEHMESMGISAALLSLSSPDAYCDSEGKTRRLYREINEAGAEVVGSEPHRFGYFAAVPLPDVKGAIQEATYALGQLKADGIRLMTNTKGLYLGDGALEPLFELLDNYAAIVFVHPCRPSVIPENLLADYPVPMLEFMFDTARAVTNLVLLGVVARYPRVRYVVPHLGGVLPITIPRVQSLVQVTRQPEERPDVLGGFRSLYYDSAGPSVLQQIRPLLTMTEDTHLVYGSDWPHMPTDECEELRDILLNTDQIDEGQKRRLFRNNALTLFPRFALAQAD